MKKLLTIISILSFLITTVFASQSYTAKIEYKNILLLYTGSTASEISYDDSIKFSFIIKRVFELSERYNYKEPIILNYKFSSLNERFYISYSKPVLYRKYDFETEMTEINLLRKKHQILNITVFDTYRKQTNLLKIVEFSLKNLDSIKQFKQDLIEYKNYYINTIDTNLIKKVTTTSTNSEIVKEVLEIKLYREYDNKEYSYFSSYYTKNDMFFPYFREKDMRNNITEIVLDTLEDIRYYANVNNTLFIFPIDINTFNFYSKSKVYKNVKIIREDVVFASDVFVEEIMKGVFLLKFYNWFSVDNCAIFSEKYGMIESHIGKYSLDYYDINDYIKKK